MNPIFRRNDSTPSGIQRSVQNGLSRRKTFTQHYGRIYPNFKQYIYPNESITIQATNFLRTIPMVTPQLSRVRVMQSFVAVPLRILWYGWEDFIKGTEDSGFSHVVPYIMNCEQLSFGNSVLTARLNHVPYDVSDTWSPANSMYSGVKENTGLSFIPYGDIVKPYTGSSYPRGMHVGYDFIVHEFSYTFPSSSGLTSPAMCFFPNELGDALGCPLYQRYDVGTDSTFRHIAFDFAAYQLAYSYFYRSENVQSRVDDFYDIVRNNGDEYLAFHNFANAVPSSGVTPARLLPYMVSSNPYRYSGYFSGDNYFSGSSHSVSSDSLDVKRSSWKNVEKYPLKDGANAVMHYMDTTETGIEFGASTISLSRWRYANWAPDRFTTSNPWQQRGDEAKIAVSGSTSQTVSLSFDIPRSNVSLVGDSSVGLYIRPVNASAHSLLELHNGSAINVSADGPDQLSVPSRRVNTNVGLPNLASSLYVSPSDFRFAMALQHIKEMSAATDDRYQSYLKKFFNARAQDFRLDRPEYIGGFVQDLNVSEVVQTSEDGNTPLGTQAGRGVSGDTTPKFRFRAPEHCIILGLTYILPDTEYIGGIDREDNAIDRFDWMLPQFSGLSEQAVYNKELSDSQVNPDFVFGYEPFYNHFRWKDSKADGDFRDTLNSLGNYEYFKPWLVTRNYGFSLSQDTSTSVPFVVASVPTLSDEFLSTRNSSDYSNFSVDKSVMNPFIQDSYFRVKMVRNIPSVGVPRI